MYLSDEEILKRMEKDLVINPKPDDICIQSCSVDLRLGYNFQRFKYNSELLIDTKGDISKHFEQFSVDKFNGVVLAPGDFLLGTTLEAVTIPNDLVAIVEGRSSFARIGLTIHQTGSWIDPGFKGQITLEIKNESDKKSIRIYPRQRICQITFAELTGPVKNPYGSKKIGSKYHKQSGPTVSKINEDKE